MDFFLAILNLRAMANLASLLEEQADSFSILTSARDVAESVGTKVYIVGGYVRDALMKRKVTDIDLMVEEDGIAFAEKLASRIGSKKVVPFEKFGTAQIPVGNGIVEIASARTETYEPDSRKPAVNVADLATDLSRRDFTINAMAVSLNKAEFGELHDPFNGVQDLNVCLIRTPLDPDATFSDDPLRMLRAVRFASQLNFEIDPTITKSIMKQADRIDIVSSERVTAEIYKILDSPLPSVGLDLLQKVGLMNLVLPEITTLYGLEQPSEWHHKDIFYHTLQVVDNICKYTVKTELRFAALLHDIGKPRTRHLDRKRGWTFHGHDAIGARMIEKLAKRMKLSNDSRDYLKKLTLLHLRPIALAKEGVTDSAVRRLMVAAGDEVDDLMKLCRADITSKNPKLVKKYLGNFDQVDTLMNDLVERDSYRAFQSPVRGEQIMEECGLEPGKTVGKIKMAIEEAILDGKIENNYDEAYRYFLEIKDEFLPNETA
ncbi:MAG: HD domain-containing protein [Candidatus Neomarinimicrobiota bacterium]|nr:HD domain-containing protein [Candidatus Neomarinimicrobiota bacterium]